ncbi:abscisic acid receptor PYL4-like [Impatiens glandulifera]|uniref:abscisic acid receptor PYL4-like n=1 Tax=Impatiens glandulifera TaxID=253017 RepID=UPI001FB18E13|nr:abscisic acid receptor PYL4-like [Impatiens glandulifera]
MTASLQLNRIINDSSAPKFMIRSCTQQQQQQQQQTDDDVPDEAIPYHPLLQLDHPMNHCWSILVQTIAAPIDAVWSLVSRFDNPQAYKNFLKSCHLIHGHGDIGTLREVHVVSGLPAASSTERLEILDNERHVISFSVVGGVHRLNNYRSVTSLHECSGGSATVVVESYVVDVPQGNSKEETKMFADTIVRCNLQSLARNAENSITNKQHP